MAQEHTNLLHSAFQKSGPLRKLTSTTLAFWLTSSVPAPSPLLLLVRMACRNRRRSQLLVAPRTDVTRVNECRGRGYTYGFRSGGTASGIYVVLWVVIMKQDDLTVLKRVYSADAAMNGKPHFLRILQRGQAAIACHFVSRRLAIY